MTLYHLAKQQTSNPVPFPFGRDDEIQNTFLIWNKEADKEKLVKVHYYYYYYY